MLYPIFPRNIFGKDDLAYWDDFLSQEDINLILSQPEWLSLSHGEIGGASHQQGHNIVPEIRSSKVCWVGTKPELMPIWEKLSNTVSEVNSRYFHFDLSGFHEPIQLSAYTEHNNGHYGWHIDSGSADRSVPRKLSLSLLLSDPSEFEGGEFQVKVANDEIQTLECKKGRAWFFPSFTLHRVAPVTKGIRRSLVLWVGGPPFR